ncbi:MAG: flagellar biosynthetic protein FliR [Candidatus Cloacimonetes bacterium]|nr:flagellar biosynthetic protein FliR [Candidatus Cloacimonadota bacterium]
MFEALGFTLAEMEHFLLILARIGALLFTMPLFNAKYINGRWRLALGIFLAFICVHVLPVPGTLPVPSLFLLFLAAKEVMVGLIIGLVCNIIFEGIRLAGFLAGRLMSLTMMTLIDPTNDQSTQVISQILYFVALLLLLATNGHHFFIQAIFDSFHRVPVTMAHFPAATVTWLISMTASIFVIGIKVGAPVYAVLFLERIMLALFAKFAPQMHVLIVALPLGILIGLNMMMLFWPYYAAAFLGIFETFTGQVSQFIALFGPGY